MHKNLNKFLARLSYTKLNEDGNVIDVPNTYQMWELLRSENIFDEEIVDLFDLYINFLKTPLTLGMFIPTDSNGDIVEEPSAYSEFCTSTAFEVNDWNPVVSNECSVFRDAQERVIFHGWRLVSVNGIYEKRATYLTDGRGYGLHFRENNVWQGTVKVETVGDLNGQMRLFAAIKKV